MLNTLETSHQTTSIQNQLGPNMFEVEYVRQLQEELLIFLKGSSCTTLKDIVIGIRGQGYQVVIPFSRGEHNAV